MRCVADRVPVLARHLQVQVAAPDLDQHAAVGQGRHGERVLAEDDEAVLCCSLAASVHVMWAQNEERTRIVNAQNTKST